MLSLAQDVASKLTKTVSNVKEHVESELNLFTMSDKKIIDLIYATHVHADESFDEDSLFIIVENIINSATQNIDKVVQGSNVHVENIEERTPKANFSVPLCMLKSISSELSCKPPGEEIAHRTTLEILSKLSSYSWEAKAVLALAAFALDFGDFWLLAQLYQSDQLAKHLAMLKRVPTLIKPSELQRRRQAVLELSNLIKTTMRVIGIFDVFEKLSAYDPKDVPGLSTALDHIPVDVYWAILTIAACASKVTILISDEPDKPHDLSPYAQKIHYILNKLTVQISICRKQLAEAEAYRRIVKLLRTPTEVMVIFKALIFTKDNVQLLIDGSTNKKVQIDVLRRKNVFFFISSLDISDDDISILKPVYNTTKTEKNYAIVWIPIVEQWTDESRKKFELLRTKMPWYSVELVSPVAGLRFIKEEWHFKGKPMLVVMSPQGKVENLDALHVIRVWGVKAFPLTKQVEEQISRGSNWIGPVVKDIHPTIETWIKEEKYIFFYGGKDSEWIQQFTKKVAALANDPIIKESRIAIELFCVGKSPKGGEDLGILGRFWSAVESLFVTKARKPVDPVTQEIQKLLSYKNESGWAVLSKGSSVVVAGHGLTIIRVIDEFEKWKEVVKEKGFEFVFKEYHNKVTQSVQPCCRLDVPNVPGSVPEIMQCPECPRTMESFISYKCCHVDAPMNAHH